MTLETSHCFMISSPLCLQRTEFDRHQIVIFKFRHSEGFPLTLRSFASYGAAELQAFQVEIDGSHRQISTTVLYLALGPSSNIHVTELVSAPEKMQSKRFQRNNLFIKRFERSCFWYTSRLPHTYYDDSNTNSD